MDPISNFLNTFKMASRTEAASFTFPHSRLISSIAAVLERKGYVASSRKVRKGRDIEVTLLSGAKFIRVTTARRVSKLSKRLYRRVHEIRPVRSGAGIAVLSTPKGLLSDADARAANVGGEVLFEIW